MFAASCFVRALDCICRQRLVYHRAAEDKTRFYTCVDRYRTEEVGSRRLCRRSGRCRQRRYLLGRERLPGYYTIVQLCGPGDGWQSLNASHATPLLRWYLVIRSGNTIHQYNVVCCTVVLAGDDHCLAALTLGRSMRLALEWCRRCRGGDCTMDSRSHLTLPRSDVCVCARREFTILRGEQCRSYTSLGR